MWKWSRLKWTVPTASFQTQAPKIPVPQRKMSEAQMKTKAQIQTETSQPTLEETKPKMVHQPSLDKTN